MKFIYIILFLYLFFTGCSTTYKIEEYPSNKKFYEDFNKSIKGKDTEIHTKEDSVIFSDNDLEIDNDSLFLTDKKIEKSEKQIPLSELKNIDYTNNSFERTSAFLELKSGENLEAENIQILKDSIRFDVIKHLTIKNSISEINLESVSYKSRLMGTFSGFLIGTLSGAIIGGFTHVIPASENHSSLPPYQGEYNRRIALALGTISGAIIGTIMGWLLGYNYNYQF